MCGLSGEFLLRMLLLNFVYFENNFVTCDELTNTVFNTDIRKYSVKEDDTNATDVKTLQKEEVGRYAGFAPIRNPIRFKEIPDNALSSSSYGRGLLHHEHAAHEGYGLHEGFYGDASHYGHGYEYVHGDDHHDFDNHHNDHHGHDHHGHDHHGHDHHGHDHHDHDHHGHDHHGHDHHEHDHHGHDHHGHDHHGHDHHEHDHHGHEHHGYGHHSGHHHLGHHHKHLDHHHLATKALLWPIAGIALLGAAAALVTNPVLLQLGVVSGRRRRRDTVEISGPDFNSDENWPLDPYKRKDTKDIPKKANEHRNVVREKKVTQTLPGHAAKPKSKANRYIPIPLKLNGD